MVDGQSEMKGLFTAAESRSDRWTELLKQSDDLVAVVLRGHLVFEEILFRVVQSHCTVPEHLAGARLRFLQLLALTRALEKLPAIPPATWQALERLNSVRNALAHNLPTASLAERVSSFVEASLGSERTSGLTTPPSSKESVSNALHFLLGQLQVLDVFTEAVEHLIGKELSRPE